MTSAFARASWRARAQGILYRVEDRLRSIRLAVQAAAGNLLSSRPLSLMVPPLAHAGDGPSPAPSLRCSDAGMDEIDLLVEGGTFVTVDAQETVIDDGFAAIDKGRIIAIGPLPPPWQRQRARQVIDTRGRLVIPGLINTHAHVGMTLMRGLCDGPPLSTWYSIVHRLENLTITPEHVRVAAGLAIAEMIRSGTTTFNDHYFFSDAVAQTAKAAGMRAVVAETVVDGTTPTGWSAGQALELTARLLERWQHDPLIRVSIGPHYPNTCRPETLRAARELADRHAALLHLHISEGARDRVLGMSHLQYLEWLGVLGDRMVAAHCVHLSPEDIDRIVGHRVGVSYNPVSNMKLGDGIAPVTDLLAAGATVGLGTDGAASSHRLDLFEVMRAGALLQSLAARDRRGPLLARQVFEMATRGGASVLRQQDALGSLEVGKKADLAIIDLGPPHLVPVHDVCSLLVYAASGADVESVIIDGRVVMRERALLTIDEPALLDQARVYSNRLRTTLRSLPDATRITARLRFPLSAPSDVVP